MALNFEVKLTSELFENVRLFEREVKLFLMRRMSHKESVADTMRSKYSNLSDQEFLEVEYEFYEATCVRKQLEGMSSRIIGKDRIRKFDAARNPDMLKMLSDRPSVKVPPSVPFIQMLGRGIRLRPGKPIDKGGADG